MHIAICLWGILRSLTYTIHSIHQQCLIPILEQGHTYEIFVHTYNFSGSYMSVRNNERAMRLNFSEWKILNPDHVQIENQDAFDASFNFTSYMTLGDPWHTNYTSFVNHLRALNSLRQLALAVEREAKTTHFDGVVYLRPDVTYLNELPIYLLQEYKNMLFVPNFHRKCFGGEYNDRFAMGDYRSAIIYGKKLDSALAYSLQKPLHSEKFTYTYLKENNVPVLEIPFRFRRVRANGVLHDRDELVYSPKQQQHLIKTDTLPHRTEYYMRCFYNFLEYVTLGQMYVWAHDDTENQLCTPNKHIDLPTLMKKRKVALALAAKREKSPRCQQTLLQIRSVQDELKVFHDSIKPFSPVAPLPPEVTETTRVVVRHKHLRGNHSDGTVVHHHEHMVSVIRVSNHTGRSEHAKHHSPVLLHKSSLVNVPLVAQV